MIRLDGATVTVPSPSGGTCAILDGVDLAVEHGEWLAVVGANGSGKTTLLKVLAALLPLSRGTLTFDAGAAPRVGMLLQEPDNQLITSSVGRELALSAGRGARDAVDDAVVRFSLGGLWDRDPHRLSGGEKQRVALSTVWLERPDVVLLDEPIAFLDPPTAARCVEFVGEMRERGAAVVWAASNDEDVAHADTVVRLDGGRVVFRGTREEYERTSARAAHTAPPPRATPTQTAATLVELDGVSVSYGDDEVFSGVDLHVAEGECVGVLGNNGAGKSSLLLLAAGALTASRGGVKRAFERAASGGTQHVFFLPQSPERMFFAESVRTELTFGLRRLGVRGAAADARAAAALGGVGLDPAAYLERSPFALSAGEMRRVAFAVALTLEPSLLLLDEPTAGLDADGVGELYRLLEHARRTNTAVVIASHDARLLSVCERLVTLPDRVPR